MNPSPTRRKHSMAGSCSNLGPPSYERAYSGNIFGKNLPQKIEAKQLGTSTVASIGGAFARIGLKSTSHCTDTVTPAWLLMLPIDTTIAKFPVGVSAGICRFTCKTPETMPGASPAN